MLDFFDPPDASCLNTSMKMAYLYDGAGAAPAVLLSSPRSDRPVVVENPAGASYVFRPVDKVVYGPSNPKRGDVLFHSKDRLQLIFAEVKLWHVSGWFKAGVVQLKSVISDFIQSHPLIFASSRIRRAYVCNPYHAKFAYSHADDIRDFRRETRFVLHPEGAVRIG